MFQLHLVRWPWGWRWEPGQGCLTPQLSQDAQPPPSCRAGSLRSLLIQIQTLQAPTSRPACLRRHPQSSTNAPESCWTGHLPPHPLRDRSLCLYNSGSRPGSAPQGLSFPIVWRQNWSGRVWFTSKGSFIPDALEF